MMSFLVLLLVAFLIVGIACSIVWYMPLPAWPPMFPIKNIIICVILLIFLLWLLSSLTGSGIAFPRLPR